jgi:hypothetical protein
MIRSPVIITGMHRSGTTLLTDMLLNMGLFVGDKYGKNKEDFFFQRRNEWLMRRSGGGWDYPEPSRSLLDNIEVTRHMVSLFQNDVNSYLFNSHQKVISAGAAWGWKDPRMVFTFPLWDKVFPGSRLLYIKRNGVDVANSLHVRAKRQGGLLGVDSIPIKLKLTNVFLRYERYVYESVRCANLSSAYKLWEEYTLEAEKLFNSYTGHKMTVKYEEFLEDPESTLERVAEFCDLDVYDKDCVSELTRKIDSSRKYAFLSDKRLLSFYDDVKDRSLMKVLGYDSLC